MLYYRGLFGEELLKNELSYSKEATDERFLIITQAQVSYQLLIISDVISFFFTSTLPEHIMHSKNS